MKNKINAIKEHMENGFENFLMNASYWTKTQWVSYYLMCFSIGATLGFIGAFIKEKRG